MLAEIETKFLINLYGTIYTAFYAYGVLFV